jgi:hypothetical protein
MDCEYKALEKPVVECAKDKYGTCNFDKCKLYEWCYQNKIINKEAK